MRDVNITIEKVGDVGKDKPATDAAEKAIYVENDNSKAVYCITLCGAYSRKYYFVTELSVINTERVLLDGVVLIVCLWSDIVIIDLPTDNKRKVINVTSDLDMFGIYKFKSGYFVHGEMTNRYFDSEFNMLWDAGGRDIFYCPERENSIEIHEDHIDVWDFLGYKYSYNEFGEITYVWVRKLDKYAQKRREKNDKDER